MLLPETPLDGALTFAERLRARVEELAVEHEGQEIRFTGSIGVAALPPADTLDQLIARADEALYGAKRGGRNRVWSAATQPPPHSG